MTRQKQFDLTKALREAGYRSRIDRCGLAWRVTVSPTQLKEHRYTKSEYNEQGRFVRNVEVVSYHNRNTSTMMSVDPLLVLFRECGYPYAKMLRMCSSGIVFELDHDYNFWKILQNSL